MLLAVTGVFELPIKIPEKNTKLCLLYQYYHGLYTLWYSIEAAHATPVNHITRSLAIGASHL